MAPSDAVAPVVPAAARTFTSNPQNVQDQHVSQGYNRINPQRLTAHLMDNAHLQSDNDSGQLLSPQLVGLSLQKHSLGLWLACSYAFLH